jgi:hypothetical protein
MGRMGAALRKIRSALEVLVWVCITLIPVNNTAVIDPIFFSLLLYFIVTPERWKIIGDHKVFLILMVQYPLWNMLRIFLTPQHEYEIVSSPATYEMWVYTLLAIVFATVFFARSGVAKYARVFIPISLICTFGVASYHYHFLDIHKVRLWNANVFEASLFTTSLAFILYGLTQKKHVKKDYYAVLTVVPTLIISIAYAGTRGIALAQATTLLIAFATCAFKKNYLEALSLAAGTTLGVGLGLWIDASVGESFLTRLQVIWSVISEYGYLISAALGATALFIGAAYFAFRTLRGYALGLLALAIVAVGFTYQPESLSKYDLSQAIGHEQTSVTDTRDAPGVVAGALISNAIKISNGVDISAAYRFQFLSLGLGALEGRLLLGLGAYMEPHIVHFLSSYHMHLHNNYLSWLVWGGLFTLLSGCIWLSAPMIASPVKLGTYQNFAAPMLALLWAVSLLFDSFLTWKNFNAIYIILACLAYHSGSGAHHSEVRRTKG